MNLIYFYHLSWAFYAGGLVGLKEIYGFLGTPFSGHGDSIVVNYILLALKKNWLISFIYNCFFENILFKLYKSVSNDDQNIYANLI